MRELLGVDLDPDVLRDAFALTEAGADPIVVTALTRLKPAMAKKLFIHVNGESPKPGRNPDSFGRFVRVTQQHFHSNYLYNMYGALQSLGLPDSQVILQAYRAYREQFKASHKLFDVNEAYSLFALLRQPDVVKDVCDECHTSYFLQPYELSMGSATCPCCKVFKRRHDTGQASPATHAEPRRAVVA